MLLLYYLDRKIPKSLNSLVSSFYLDFFEYLSCSGLNRVNKKLAKEALECFCYNLVRAGVYNQPVNITLDSNSYDGNMMFNGRKAKRKKVSYKYTTCLLDFMVGNGYIHLEKGSVGSWLMVKGKWVPDETTCSQIHRLLPLDERLAPYTKKDNILPLLETVVLRNAKGKDVQFKPTSEIREIIKMLDKYNELALRHTVMVGDDEFEVQGKKVFNNSSFDDGGRTYYAGGSVQTLSSDLRSTITIDGETVISFDFKSLHPAICAVKEGILLPEGFDPYGIKLPELPDKLVRSICKMVVLICINAPDYRSAQGAVTSEIAIDYRKWVKDEDCKWKELHEHKNAFPTKDAIMELTNHNPYLVPYFHTGEGIKLQNIDSKIMDRVINKFLQKDELVLLIHDEVIARKSVGEEVLETMKEAYLQTLGTLDNCIIEEK